MKGNVTLATVLVCLIGGNPAQAVEGGSDVPHEEARFDAACAVIRTGFLTPGSCSDCFSADGSATLIAPDLVLTARHILAFAGTPSAPLPYSIRFRVDPSGSYGQYDASLADDGWSSFYHVPVAEWWFSTGVADLALARLEYCVTHIEPIPVRFIDGTDLDADYDLKIAGWGNEGCGSLSTQSPTRRLKVCCNAVDPHVSALYLG